MPDRMRARAVLTALLLAIVIVGIRAAGPAVGWVPPSRAVIIGIGVGLEVLLAGLFLALKRAGARAGQPSPSGAVSASGASPSTWTDDPTANVATRLRGILFRVLGACLIMIPMAMLLAIIRKPRIHPTPQIRTLLRHGGGHASHVAVGGAHGTFSWAFVQYAIISLLLAAVVVVLALAWRGRTLRTRLTDASFDDVDDAVAELARAVESGRQALRELDDARAAIIACYVAMEKSLADAGATRRAAETPDELLSRAVADELVRARPARALTTLFYEARFSSHAMPAAKQDQARRALAELSATLTARPSEAAR